MIRKKMIKKIKGKKMRERILIKKMIKKKKKMVKKIKKKK